MLAVSFSDGSLSVLNLDIESGNEDIEIFSDITGYEHYEGGFYQNFLAIAASNLKTNESIFMTIDVNTVTETGGFQSEGYYTASTSEEGIVVGVDNVLVKIDPATGEQTPLIDTAYNVDSYCYDSNYTAVSNSRKTMVFDIQQNLVGELERDVRSNLLTINNDSLLIGSSDSPIILIAKYKDHYESEFAQYEKSLTHDEARVSGDRKTMMYFSYDSFNICDLSGTVLSTVNIPNAKEVYDQQYKRDGIRSYLEVVYYDGSIKKYDAANGNIIEENRGEPPNPNMDEVFETSTLRIESPLHGTPIAYNKQTGKKVKELEGDAYLTYITEIDDYIVAQYMTTDNQYFGYLMNQQCEKLAYLPNVCDVLTDGFLFDYHSGYIRETPLYDIETLLEMARSKIRKN